MFASFMSCRVLALLSASLIFSGAALSGEPADVTGFDIEGFKLGMTLEEVQEKFPDFSFREVKRKGGVVGYEGKFNEITASFTSEKLGKKLFRILLMRIFKKKPDPYPIYMEYVKKYGRPDFSGRQMMSINACWGRCYGDEKRLEFSMTVVGFGAKPFPMTLTLEDPLLGKKNRELFKTKR